VKSVYPIDPKVKHILEAVERTVAGEVVEQGRKVKFLPRSIKAITCIGNTALAPPLAIIVALQLAFLPIDQIRDYFQLVDDRTIQSRCMVDWSETAFRGGPIGHLAEQFERVGRKLLYFHLHTSHQDGSSDNNPEYFLEVCRRAETLIRQQEGSFEVSDQLHIDADMIGGPSLTVAASSSTRKDNSHAVAQAGERVLQVWENCGDLVSQLISVLSQYFRQETEEERVQHVLGVNKVLLELRPPTRKEIAQLMTLFEQVQIHRLNPILQGLEPFRPDCDNKVQASATGRQLDDEHQSELSKDQNSNSLQREGLAVQDVQYPLEDVDDTEVDSSPTGRHGCATGVDQSFPTAISDRNQARWNLNFDLLCQYKNDHGDCLVSKGYVIDDVSLGEWVNTQRNTYRKLQEGKPSPMTQERINKLETLGFVWEPLKDQWNSNFDLLRQYKEGNGDCLVPQSYVINDIALGVWVGQQRQDYRTLQEGKSSPMTQERINKLETLGFVWNALEAQWNSNFELLHLYKKDYGDCLVPHRYVIDGVALGKWVDKQRQDYRTLQEGKSSLMTQERIKKLSGVGFVWNALEAQWNSNFELLHLYKKDHGDCLVPKSYMINGVALGSWVNTQRHEYRKLQEGKSSVMTQERINKLEALGFVWEPFEDQWDACFEECQQWIEAHEHGRVFSHSAWTSSTGVSLGNWVTKQRRAYWKFLQGHPSQLTKERVDRLNAIGFVWDPTEAKRAWALDLLRGYKEEHGHCQVPPHYINPDGVKFGVLIGTLRCLYNKLQEERKAAARTDTDNINDQRAAISHELINEFQKIGFEW